MCSCYRMPANAPTTATLMRAAWIGRLMRNRRHTRRICATLYLSRGGVTEGCCPQAFSELATTRRANDVPRKRHSDLKLRQHLPGNRALLATNCGNDQEAKL